MSEQKPGVTKKAGSTEGLVIQNFTVARPPVRTKFDLGDWRDALIHAEAPGGNRVSLYDLYTDVLLDPHLTSQWGKLVMSITNNDWQFVTDDGKEIPEIQDMLDSPEFEILLTEIVNSEAWGISVFELGKEKLFQLGKTVSRLSIYSVPRKHIRPKEGVIVKEQFDAAGIAGVFYREGQYANYVAEIGSHDNLGLILKATPYVLLKRGDVGDWAQFVQLFGMPFREYRYSGYDETTEALLKKNAEEMGSAPYMILPDGTSITFHDLKHGTGAGDVYERLAKFCDEQISILLLGNTETTTSSDGSGYAQSKTHRESENDIKAAYKKRVRRALNRVVKPILYNLGWNVARGNFVPREEDKLDEKMSRLKILQSVKNLGAPVSDEQVYEQSGVAKPDNYDELKKKQEEEASVPEPKSPKPKPKPKKAKEEKLAEDENMFVKWVKSFFDQAR
jgi:phage gp29-like protein